MRSTISKHEIIERVAEGYFREVIVKQDPSLSSKVAKFDSFDLAEFLMDEYSTEELEVLWQNYVLRRSPRSSVRELGTKPLVD